MVRVEALKKIVVPRDKALSYKRMAQSDSLTNSLIHRRVSPSCPQNSLESIYPIAWRWALARANWDAEIAREAVHNAFVAILEGRVKAHSPEFFRSFVLGVVERYIRREQRWQGLRRLLPWSAKTDLRQSEALSPEIQGDAMHAWRALRKLSVRQRSVAWLVLGCDLSIDEASQVLGMPLGTARTHFARAKQNLRASFVEPSHE